MKIPPGNPFCVYTHSANKVVFYVGKGLASRILDTANRNDLWLAKVSVAGYVAEVISWHDTETEARIAEKVLIQKLRPECNKLINGFKHSEATRKKMAAARRRYVASHGQYQDLPTTAVVCIETGQIFKGINIAGRALGVDATGISRCVNGRKKQVGGLTFRRSVVGGSNGS